MKTNYLIPWTRNQRVCNPEELSGKILEASPIKYCSFIKPSSHHGYPINDLEGRGIIDWKDMNRKRFRVALPASQTDIHDETSSKSSLPPDKRKLVLNFEHNLNRNNPCITSSDLLKLRDFSSTEFILCRLYK
eukprot:756013-Hanusia_phi.AAC.11